MARYTGPSTKIARKFGEPIYGADKDFEKRNYPPGQHGAARKRARKSTEYGNQLKEKQKVKYMYGVLERQFRNTYEKACRMQGQKGENLLFLLESRLDNIVYRLGIAPTRAAARQIVRHCHITLNGIVPSAQVKAGDVIAVRERSKSLEVIQSSVASAKKYSWLDFDAKALSGGMLPGSRKDRHRAMCGEVPDLSRNPCLQSSLWHTYLRHVQ